jgi:hypothetical protein
MRHPDDDVIDDAPYKTIIATGGFSDISRWERFANLKARAVMNMSKLGIAMTLDEYEQLVREYVAEVAEPDSLVDWHMTDLILWLRKRTETTDGTKPTDNNDT